MVDTVPPPTSTTPPAAPSAPGGEATPPVAPSLVGGTPPDGGTPPKASEPAPPKAADAPPPAPELKFEALKIPEGLKLEGETKNKFTSALQEADPNKRAQAILDIGAAEIKRVAEAAHQGFHDMNRQWVDAVKADPEIGGDKLSAVQATISKALDTFGTPGVRSALNLTGAGNNPDVIKTFYKMAKALTEGGHAAGNPPAQAGEKDLSELLYPTMKGNG